MDALMCASLRPRRSPGAAGTGAARQAGALSPGEIAYPLRAIFKRDRNVRVLLAGIPSIPAAPRILLVETIGTHPGLTLSCSRTKTPTYGVLEADEGTRTLDLLHGKQTL